MKYITTISNNELTKQIPPIEKKHSTHSHIGLENRQLQNFV